MRNLFEAWVPDVYDQESVREYPKLEKLKKEEV